MLETTQVFISEKLGKICKTSSTHESMQIGHKMRVEEIKDEPKVEEDSGDEYFDAVGSAGEDSGLNRGEGGLPADSVEATVEALVGESKGGAGDSKARAAAAWEAAMEGRVGPSTSDDADEALDEDFVDVDYLRELEAGMGEDERGRAEERSAALKKDGNTAFGEGRWTDAAAKYREALWLCPPSRAQDRAVLHSNRAAALMKAEEWKRAAKECDRALDLSPDYLKALQRRATCHQASSEHYDEALRDWQRVLELEPGSRAARDAVLRLGPLIQRRNEELKTEMMGKLKDLGNLCLRPFGMSTDNFELVQQDGGGYSIRTKGGPSP